MKLSKSLQAFAEDAQADDAYWVEEAKMDFSTALEKQRRRAGLTYAAIAKRIGSSAAYITKVFRGESNLTIESMVKLARSTGGRVQIQIIDEAADTKLWVSTMVELSRTAANQPTMRTASPTVIALGSYAQGPDKLAA